MVEQLTFNQLVRGSSPRLATSNEFHSLASTFIRLKKVPRHALLHIPLIGRIAQW